MRSAGRRQLGLEPLADTLLVVETAARPGDLLVLASSRAPELAEAGLRRLGRQPA